MLQIEKLLNYKVGVVCLEKQQSVFFNNIYSWNLSHFTYSFWDYTDGSYNIHGADNKLPLFWSFYFSYLRIPREKNTNRWGGGGVLSQRWEGGTAYNNSQQINLTITILTPIFDWDNFHFLATERTYIQHKINSSNYCVTQNLNHKKSFKYVY